MRKIAAHYILRADGSVGKFPIVEFDNEGVILNIREREKFLEEPSLELVNGFLCPGFVDVIPDEIFGLDEIEIKKYLNRQVIAGVKVLCASQNNISILSKVKPKEIILILANNELLQKTSVLKPLFTELKEKHAGLELLNKYTSEHAVMYNVSSEYGSIEIGKKPGIIAISGMKYESMTLTETSKIKLII